MRWSPGTPGRVKAQKPRPVGPAHRLGEGITDGLNGMWVHRSRKRGRNLPRGESSEGQIPRAPPVRNRTGTGSEGVSRQEGNQTLQAERSGPGEARELWTSEPWCAEGNESPREALVGCGRRARSCWAILWRKAKLEERVHWSLNVISAVRRRKTTKPRKWPTAKWDRQTSTTILQRMLLWTSG